MKARNEQQFIQSLGRRIADVRKAKGMTQEKLAAETELDRVALAYIETGKRKPRVTSVYKIAVALNIEVSDLFKNL